MNDTMESVKKMSFVLDSYAVKTGFVNWDELIKFCNNDTEEISAHYSLVLANYIQKNEVEKNQNDSVVFENGKWYIFKEPGQEKLLIRVEDADKMICSGWNCKGQVFQNQWMYLGNRLKLKTENIETIHTINDLFYNLTN